MATRDFLKGVKMARCVESGYHMNCFIVDGGDWFVENVKVSDKLD
jgi:hypothetical protein